MAKSRTQLSDFTFTFHFHALEKEMATHSSVLAWRIPGTGEPGGKEAAEGPATLAGVRVSFAVLDGLVDLLSEMVIQRNRLGAAVEKAGAGATDVRLAFESLAQTLELMQERVMGLRMTPLQALFGSLRRIVHDESRREEKDVELVTDGGETPLDRALLELASEALGHLVRNAVVHGLETAAARRAARSEERRVGKECRSRWS